MFGRVALVFLAVLCIPSMQELLAREEKTAFERLQAFSPREASEVLKADDWQVKEWVLGAERQRDLKPIKANQIIKVGSACYVAEKETGRWLVGHATGRGKNIECDLNFRDFKTLMEALAYAPLPRPPEGFMLREVGCLPNRPSRLASDGKGKILYVLCVNGDIWRVDVETNQFRQILWASKYMDPSRGELFVVGMTLDRERRLYVVANQRIDTVKPITNEVTIYRSTATRDGDPAEPKPWLKTAYPWGIGPFNHGVGHIDFGPDGFLYVNSGSRTDGNEEGKDPRYSREGETPLTACIWRLDPKAEKPKIEVHARGLRNAYGFCWNDKGEMFATDNGPDADAPEELNLIEKGKHYGFPFKFSNWDKKPYPHTPEPAPEQKFVLPIANLGPDSGGSADKPLYTFDPHSSPSGIVFLNNEFPRDFRGTYLVARFGNFIQLKKDVGFDVVHVRLEKNKEGIYQAHMKTLLAPIARPVDLHLSGKGKVYICEHSRQIENKGYSGMLPGRILELAVKPAP